MNPYELKGRGLFVFSDPGGAKPILGFIALKHHSELLVVSDRVYDFFSHYNVQVEKYNQDDEVNLIDGFRPDFVYTGTSYTSNIEMKFICEAKKREIPTIVFIDHYTKYLDRFKIDGELIFPDYIFLTDDRAKEIACSYGMDKFSIIFVTGNFHHKFLKTWKPIIERNNLLKDYKINASSIIVTFAPDPLSNINGKEEYKFDETDIWETLATELSKIKNDKLVVILKMHPNQNREYLLNFISDSNYTKIFLPNDIDTNTIIYYSDLIIGMYSSFLIEANLWDKKIIRILPNTELKDALEGMNIGSIVNSNESLSRVLNMLI
jgi:hypothetical protein